MANAIRSTMVAAASLFIATQSCGQSLTGDVMFAAIYTGSTNSISSVTPTPVYIKVHPSESDQVRLGCCILVNVNAEVIHIRFHANAQGVWGDIGSFNGVKFTSVNWKNLPAGWGLRYTVSTNMLEELCSTCEPMTERVIVSDTWVAFDFRRLIYNSDSYFDVMVVPAQ